jgi:hypothetical protein
LEISLGKERETFVCRHTCILRPAKRGHFAFDTKENLLNRLDLLLNGLFPLRTLGGWSFFPGFALLRHGEISIFLFRHAQQ